MAIPSKTPVSAGVDDFISGAAATRAEAAAGSKKEKKAAEPKSKYLLAIDKKMREQIRIEAIGQGINMSEYICDILRRRKELA